MLMPSIFGENLIDDFLEEPFRGFHSYTPMKSVMETDVREQDNAFELSISLPGVKKEDIQAELKDGYLTINATTSRNHDERDGNDRYIRRERYYGTASRSFYVGTEVTQEEIKAKYENGILSLNIPKKEKKKSEVEEKKYIAIEG